MRKSVAILSAMILISILSSPALAQDDLTVTLSPNLLNLNTSETKTVQITVQNNRDVDDTFSLTVWPSIKWAGVTPNLEKYIVKVPAKSNFTSNLFLTASSDAEEVITSFLVTAKSLNNATILESDSVRVQVMRRSAVYISEIKLDKYTVSPEGVVGITVIVTNSGDADSFPMGLQTNVRTDTEILKRYDYDLGRVPSISTKLVQHTYDIGKYMSQGTYSVEVLLRDSLNTIVDSGSVTFKVNGVRNIMQGSSVSYSLFSQSKVITVSNEGNTLEEGFYVTESLPKYTSSFFFPDKEPDKMEEKDNRIVYSWYVQSLPPGSSISIKYEVRYFAIWLLGLAVIGIIIVAFRYAYALKIVKRHNVEGRIESGKEITISLDVRNPTLHEIKNVVISDYVPTIASVVDRFDTMKPAIRRMEHGTELTWRIKTLKPREERVVTYRIKPLVEIIGTMRLPKASIDYLDRKQRKKSVASKTVIIQGK